MAKIDKHSMIWRRVLKFIEDERSEAVKLLIDDSDSEQQRGIIFILDKLKELPDDRTIEPIKTDTYND